MNREILFRGKRLHGGRSWVYGSLIQGPDASSIWSIELKDDVEVDPATVGQYTGLTDRNGVKIFEGDKCRVTRTCVIEYGIIAFKNACFWFFDDGPSGMIRLCDVKVNGYEIEVIGNIHDNPELLQEAPNAHP